MVGKVTSGLLALIGLALWNCSAVEAPAKGVWIANPAFAEADSRLCSARMEPQKSEYPFFTAFLLTLENTSDTELSIDWNESQYLFNGKPQGPLVFRGIDAAAVKNATVPPESLSAGERLSRELMPMRLIAWTPLSEKSAQRHGITPGMLPAGENGILLVLRQKGGRVAIPLSVRLSREASP